MNMKRKQVDRLSNLPDSILIRILSFLPTRDAAKTVAIKPFGDLWTNIDSLDFDDLYFSDKLADNTEEGEIDFNVYQKFTRFIRNFILLYKTPTVHKFRVSFEEKLRDLSSAFAAEHPEMEEENLVNEVQMWVKFALCRQVECLDLSFGDPDISLMDDIFTVPSVLWTSSSLVELKLCNCKVGNLQKVRMELLTVLVFKKVPLSDDEITNIINNCPLLEDVSIIDCFDLEDLSFTNPSVKKLRVFMKNDNGGFLWYLGVNCPNVRSFEYTGYGDCLDVINLSSLKAATLGLNFFLCDDTVGFVELKKFLETVQHVEDLKLGQEVLAVLIHHVVRNHPSMCNKWKRLEFNTTLNGKYISGICSLLKHSSHLEELIINISDPLQVCPEEIEWELYDMGDVWEYDWSSEFSIQNLKTVTMHGLLRGSYSAQIELVKVILKNAPVLDKVCIYTKGDALLAEKNPIPSNRLFEISKKILTFPRASKQATVLLL